MADINTAAIDAYIKESRVGNAGVHNYGTSKVSAGLRIEAAREKRRRRPKKKQALTGTMRTG